MVGQKPDEDFIGPDHADAFVGNGAITFNQLRKREPDAAAVDMGDNCWLDSSLLHLKLIAGLLHQGAAAIHDLDHMRILGEDDENVLGGHREPGLHAAFVANEVLIGLLAHLRDAIARY